MLRPSRHPREHRRPLAYCEYIDLTVSWIEEEDWPEGWCCPRCGGTTFEGVHRDYPPAGIQPGSFTVEFGPDR
jgi:hypothetical protein